MNCVKAASNIFAASSFPVESANPDAAQEATSRHAWCIMIVVEDEWVSPFLFNFRWFSNPQLPFAVALVFIFFSLLLSLQISGQQKEKSPFAGAFKRARKRERVDFLFVCVCV